jgi:hypothetical protein
VLSPADVADESLIAEDDLVAPDLRRHRLALPAQIGALEIGPLRIADDRLAGDAVAGAAEAAVGVVVGTDDAHVLHFEADLPTAIRLRLEAEHAAQRGGVGAAAGEGVVVDVLVAVVEVGDKPRLHERLGQRRRRIGRDGRRGRSEQEQGDQRSRSRVHTGPPAGEPNRPPEGPL